jgi:hypothetical protein
MILRSIYKMLVRLRPPEWRGEMTAVFEQAQADAWSRGWLAYAGFAMREIGGMLRAGTGSTGRWRWAAGGLAAGLLVGWVVTLANPEIYTSRALIRAVRSQIPERFVPATAPLDEASVMEAMGPAIFTRHALTSIIQTYDLYRAERTRMPMEDVITLMAGQIEFQGNHLSRGIRSISIAFSYPDPILAQRVARDIMTRLIDEALRDRSAQSTMTANFLRSEAEKAATAWEEVNAQARNASGAGAERLQLDREMAARRYQTLRERVAEAEMLVSLEERRQGPTLEVLDLPSLPERPRVSHWMILAAGAAGGLFLGLLARWVWRIRIPAPGFEAVALR